MKGSVLLGNDNLLLFAPVLSGKVTAMNH